MEIVLNVCYGGFGISEEAEAWMKERGYDFDGRYNIPRNHPLLIECVRTLDRKADGRYARLAIEEVDESRPWFLEEYDGIECIRYFDPNDHGCNLVGRG